MKRFVTISGDKDAIEELEKVCTSPELFIGREKGRFVLKSKKFNELSNDEDIYKEACETAALLNGAVKLALGYKGNLHIDMVVRVSDSGQWILHGILSGGTSSSGKLIMKMTKADGTVISEAAHVPQLVHAAMSNERAAKVLKQIAENNLDWNNLNIIFEDIEGDVGSTLYKGKVEDEVKRFTQTVQPYRHGRKGLYKTKYTPPKNPMTFAEAQSFVMSLVENWLRSKTDEETSTSKNDSV